MFYGHTDTHIYKYFKMVTIKQVHLHKLNVPPLWSASNGNDMCASWNLSESLKNEIVGGSQEEGIGHETARNRRRPGLLYADLKQP